jgi:hypothetical protein
VSPTDIDDAHPGEPAMPLGSLLVGAAATAAMSGAVAMLRQGE